MNSFPQHVFHDPIKTKEMIELQHYKQLQSYLEDFDPLAPPAPDPIPTKISTEALKQREGRNKRAICNRELLLLSLSCGAEIVIDKTKKTSQAKKVFVGSTIFFDGEYHINEILENAFYFECGIRVLWKKARMNYESTLQLSSENVIKEMENIRQHPEIIETLKEDFKLENSESAINSTGKRRTKNKEAAFSNFLAYKLILMGFSLTCQVSAQKITTKTLNYYIWKQYRSPNGKIVSKELLQPYIKSLSKEIKYQLNKESSVKISPNILHIISAQHLADEIGIETNHQPQTELSAFIPSFSGIVDNDFVFIKRHHLHPFSIRDILNENN